MTMKMIAVAEPTYTVTMTVPVIFVQEELGILQKIRMVLSTIAGIFSLLLILSVFGAISWDGC
jgi:hypothetical protein